MEIIKRMTEAVLSPLGVVILLMAGGLALGLWRRHRRTGHRLLIAGTILFLLFLFSPLAEFLVLGLERHFPSMLTPPSPPAIDRIVVLAGYGEDVPGFPVTSSVSGQTLCCMAEGLRLYRLLPGAKLLMSGGVVRRGDRPVAAIMADFLQQLGVRAGDLIVEGNSRNTYENLFEVRKLIGSRPFILVAAGCDLRRAVGVARKLGMNPYPAPACIWTLQDFPPGISVGRQVTAALGKPSLTRISRLQWANHEYLGYAWYLLLGRI